MLNSIDNPETKITFELQAKKNHKSTIKRKFEFLHPIGIAPIGIQKLANSEGEFCTVKGYFSEYLTFNYLKKVIIL